MGWLESSMDVAMICLVHLQLFWSLCITSQFSQMHDQCLDNICGFLVMPFVKSQDDSNDSFKTMYLNSNETITPSPQKTPFIIRWLYFISNVSCLFIIFKMFQNLLQNFAIQCLFRFYLLLQIPYQIEDILCCQRVTHFLFFEAVLITCLHYHVL